MWGGMGGGRVFCSSGTWARMRLQTAGSSVFMRWIKMRNGGWCCKRAFGLYPTVLEGYFDASWIFNTQDSKTTSKYVFTLRGTAVSWKSSKQTVITRSTIEAEFVALEKCGEESHIGKDSQYDTC